MEGKRYGCLTGLLVGGLSVALAGSAAVGVQARERDDDRVEVAEDRAATAERPADPPLEGFWPTGRLTEYAVRRWCGQVTHDYQLDVEQAARLEEMMLRRWPGWMKANRRELQPLFNEFMENRLAPEPPSAGQVSDWAGRALRMFDSGREELRAAQGDFREWLSPVQKMKFDADVAKMNVGMEIFEQKLRVWQEGRYARDELWKQPYWQRPGEDQEGGRQQAGEVVQGESARAGPEAESATVPLDKWESYVAVFIQTYSLDSEQITSAWTIMGDLRARAERYKERHSAQYARFEGRLAESDAETRETLLARRQALDEPLARLFEELKVRLARLLTEAQRKAVEGAPATRAEPASSNS